MTIREAELSLARATGGASPEATDPRSEPGPVAPLRPARRLRILVLSPGFPTRDHPPYAPAVVDTLAELARSHDLEIHAISGTTEVGLSSYRGLDVVRYGRGDRLTRALLLGGIVAGRARARAFDAIWSLWVDRTGPAAIALSRLLRVPAVLSVMGGELAALHALEYGLARSRRRVAELALMFRSASRITAGSEVLADRFRALFPARAALLRVLPFGVRPPGPVRPARPPAGAERPLGLLSIMDLSWVKRPERALAALVELRASGVAAELGVFGSARPEERARVLAAADLVGVAGQVHLRGFVPPAELARAFAEHDVLLHPSAHESQGCALVEAALAGLPIVAYDVGVARELEALGAAIVRVKERDPLGAAVLAAVARSPAPAAHDALSGRFSVAASAARFCALFEGLVA